MKNISKKITIIELMAIAFCAIWLCSCHTFYYPSYIISPRQVNSNFMVITKNGHQYAVSRKAHSIVSMTISDLSHGCSYSSDFSIPIGTFLPFFVKVINLGNDKITFNPSRDINLFWSKTDAINKVYDGELSVWSRKMFMDDIESRASSAATMAVLGGIAAGLQSTSAALAGRSNPAAQLAAQNSIKLAEQEEKYAAYTLDRYNDFNMNNDYLGENTISPGYEVSGFVCASASDKKQASGFIIPKGKSAKYFLLMLHVGKDVHKIYFDMESFSIVHM